MNFYIFGPYRSDSICCFFNFIVQGRMAVFTVRLHRHLGRLTPVQPFIRRFHPCPHMEDFSSKKLEWESSAAVIHTDLIFIIVIFQLIIKLVR